VYIGKVFDKDRPGWIDAISLLLPGLTWAFALWVRHNDATIGLLSRFCEICETLSDPNNSAGIPGWHRNDQKWITEARAYRRYSDFAMMMTAALVSLPAIIVGGHDISDHHTLTGIAFVTVGLLGLLAAGFVWWNHVVRDDIALHSTFADTGEGYMFTVQHQSVTHVLKTRYMQLRSLLRRMPCVRKLTH
jgi:hypothetical protein